ncbi:hypothetical protein NW767_014567 [Fusarium falciforme]|nr:hypothetical protein NW767_014567 [Fusarium falciforme]
MGFFIDQAVRGLLSIGFTNADAQFVNSTLDTVFNRRCAPPAAVVPQNAGPQLQAICIAPNCLLAANDTCSSYDAVVPPLVANATAVGNFTKAANGSTSFNASATSTSSNDALRLTDKGMGVLE